VELEKTLLVPAPMDRVWALLLDPKVMAECVPGTKSVEVVSDVEYVALIQVKISFISAKFRIRTTIAEQCAPRYLKTEGTGEDASVGSSLKQTSEIFLRQQDGGATELRVKVKVDVFGRLGSFGLSVMKTKADRMWEEFGATLVDKITAPAQEPLAEAGKASEGESIAHAARLSSPTSWWKRLRRIEGADGGDPVRDEHP
jgi:carbon monoxide dehydrogenase subunit G